MASGLDPGFWYLGAVHGAVKVKQYKCIISLKKSSSQLLECTSARHGLNN